MAIPWPASPTNGQTFTYGGITYTWNGVAWINTVTNTPAVVGSVAVTSPIINTGTPTAPVIGISQSGLAIAASQVTSGSFGNITYQGLVSTTVTPASSVSVVATNSSNQIGVLGTATSVSTQFLRGDGTWQVPAGGASVIPNFRVFPTGSYFTAKAIGSTSSTILTMTAIPFWVSTTTTFTKIGIYVSSTGSASAFRLGIWNNNATTDKPDTLFADYGTVATTTTGFKEVTGQTITLSAGLWWIGGVNTGSPGATVSATTIGFPLYPIPHTTAPSSVTQYNAYSGSYTSGTLPTFVGASTPATQGFLVWLGL